MTADTRQRDYWIGAILSLFMLSVGACELQFRAEAKRSPDDGYEFAQLHSEGWGEEHYAIVQHKRTGACFVVVRSLGPTYAITAASQDVCNSLAEKSVREGR